MMDYYLQRFREELVLRGLSPRTVRAYVSCVRIFLLYEEFDYTRIDVEKIRNFLLFRIEQGLSPQSANLYLHAIRFFYRHVMHQVQPIPLRFLKRPQRLPVVLSHEEIFRIFDACSNRKHRLLLALAYGAGLRVSEVLNLRVQDLRLDEGLIFVSQGKGSKDRMTLFPEKMKNDFGPFLAFHSINSFVFESARGGKLSTRTAQKIFAKALFKAGIFKPASFHSLRHSFATHLLENGVDIRYVQALLGHSSIRTTERYTRVQNHALLNIRSPL